MSPRRRLGSLQCFTLVIPGCVLETADRSVACHGPYPMEELNVRIPVWAYDTADALDRVTEALQDLIAAENAGEIARVPDPGSD